MIELAELTASYRSGFLRTRRVILDRIAFKVPQGSIAGYLGVNGAGKTTTIKIVVGINSPDAGQVTVAGSPAGSDAARSALGYLPENPYFYEYLTPIEALDFFGRLSGMDRPARAKRSREVLDEVDLFHAAGRPVREFSKGMRQRLGLAQALLHGPKLLVLDEPLTGLDPMGRLALREIIARQKQAGTTVFFSSHILSDVEAVCDHIVILDGGKIAYEGSVEKLLQTDQESPHRLAFHDVADDKLAAITEVAGSKVDRRGARFEVETKDRATAEKTLDAVRGAGGKIDLFQPVGLSLEDYFLKTYGKKS